MSNDLNVDLFEAVSKSGYYPEVVAAGLNDALADERVVDYVLHHEPTFDRDEVRRHMTVLVLTNSRLVLVHTDEHPPDELLTKPYTSTTSEAVPVSSVKSVVVTRMVTEKSKAPVEAVMTISWGAVSRLDLEPANCGDPDCEADHGYTGNIAGDDFTLRLSATADGGAAVQRLLAFARSLSSRTAHGASAGLR
ncbi:MAG: phosphodiesterase [Kineosporiaceae bacterium]|nr:phosphodiesterase [Aeromicrobium sp.]